MAEYEILAFRADQRASKGITSAHLDDVIAGYNPDQQVAPVVIGHPTNDAPAHGAITGLRRQGSDFFVKFKDASAKLIEGVKSSALVNRSIALWDPNHPSNPNPGKYAVRHFGFLGANAPGIPNLGKLNFSADDETLEVEGEPADAVVFAAAPTGVTIITDPPVIPEGNKEFSMTEAELKAAADKLAKDQADYDQRVADQNARETQFAADQTTRRHGANASSVDGLILAGKVLPADKDALVKAFNAIPGDTIEFSADDKTDAVAKIVSIFAKGPKLAPVGDPPTSKPGEFSAEDPSGNKAKMDQALADRNKGLNEGFKK